MRLGAWLAHEFFPQGTMAGRLLLGSIWLGLIVGWLGWRLGIVLPDLASPELRAQRADRVRAQLIRIVAALTDRRNLVVCLFAGIGIAAVGPVIDATQTPYWLVAEGLSSHRTLAMGIAGGVVRGVAAVTGGWLGYHCYHLDRIVCDDSLRDEERRTNR